MSKRAHKISYTALVLVGMLLGMTAPAGAGQFQLGLPSLSPDADAGFSLDLDSALPYEEYSALLDRTPVLRGSQAADLNVLMGRNAWQEYQEGTGTEEPADMASEGGGFGRWMKKYWWIPTIVVVAAAYVISEDDDDDGDSDSDRNNMQPMQ